MPVKNIPGASCFKKSASFKKATSPLQPIKYAAKRFLLLWCVFLLCVADAYAQNPPPAQEPPAQQQAPAQGAPPSTTAPVSQAPTENVLPSSSTPAPGPSPEPVLPAAPVPAFKPSAQPPIPGAIVPGLEARLGFATLSRASAANDKVLYKGLNASVTKQYSDRIGGMLEVSYLRASDVFGTGHSNSTLTYLLGPVFYPYRRGSFVASLHALGGGARVAGVVVLTPSTGGFLKGIVDDRAWALGGGLEKWIADSLALRVDVDALHTSFYNSSVVLHGEYDLRATWGLIYYFGGGGGAKVRNVKGRQLE